jgi:hypothetical protein
MAYSSNFLQHPTQLEPNKEVKLVLKKGTTHTLKVVQENVTWNSYLDGVATGWESPDMVTAINGGLYALGGNKPEIDYVAYQIVFLITKQN